MEKTFYNLRGDAIIFNIVIFIICLTIFVSLLILSYSKSLSKDWVSNRCSPFIIPFAGYENFNYCIQNIMNIAIGDILYPFQQLLSVFASQMSVVAEGVNDIRKTASNVRNGMTEISEGVMSGIVNTTVPLQETILTTKDIFGKTEGILTTGLYTGLGTYYTLKSSIAVVINSIIRIMVIMLSIMIPLLSFPLTAPFAMPMVAAFTAISIPMGILVSTMSKDMGIKPDLGIPKLVMPKLCFTDTTYIIQNIMVL